MTYEEVIQQFEQLGSESDLAGKRKFGIRADKAYGVSVRKLRDLAKTIKKDHKLALTLWSSGIHEGQMLATMIADPNQITEELMEQWVNDIKSWDVCDGACGNLWDKTPWVWKKIDEWTQRDEEFVKRAGFALIAWTAVHDKKTDDDAFLPLLKRIEQEAGDSRNFVKKPVNWALRQIGKRNAALNKAAIETAEKLAEMPEKSAQWNAKDSLRELTAERVQERLRKK